MKNIKIYISYHRDLYFPAHSHLYPIQVGVALECDEINTTYKDNVGIDNISTLNKSYCELTAQYWVWKNQDADYYGFFHYKRYLSFIKKGQSPYIIRKRPTEKTLTKLGYDCTHMQKIIESADVIVPVPEDMHISVYERYLQAPYHHKCDIDIVSDIITEKYPEYINSRDTYFNGSNNYFGNIFIMKSELFNDYCTWLFDILSEYNRRKDVAYCTEQEMRVSGFLGERLLGVYITKLKTDAANILELPRVHFEAMSGKHNDFYSKKFLNFFFPPGSWLRYKMKRFSKKLNFGVVQA